jgi:hypothetical protein
VATAAQFVLRPTLREAQSSASLIGRNHPIEQ